MGKLIGNFGWEGKPAARVEGAELVEIMELVRAKLLAAGFVDEPAWHFHFEPDR